jgi:hypothetical protein
VHGIDKHACQAVLTIYTEGENMKNADMSPAAKARVDAQATFERRASEWKHAVHLNATGDCSDGYVRVKFAEYQDAAKKLIQATIEERRRDQSETDCMDYENDWAGEARISPGDGNTFVLRKVWPNSGEYWVRINDAFGGHDRVMALDEWVKWGK